ncbi:MAG: class I SAM-dependent rRNA methyltransferase [Verrucomicrobia bacterium]|nr:class I SAM-dependent rRNA methyltransferase [Verrucomicrobiota bacterium]
MSQLILKPGRDKSLNRRHPWIFSGAVARVEGDPQIGETVEVRSAGGAVLALAAYSPHSQIRARVWSWEMGDNIDKAFIAQRVTLAAARREGLLGSGVTDAVRLIHGETDGLPGIVADRYGDTVVVQLLSAGADFWRDAIADAMMSLPGVVRVEERSDADVRQLEGLPSRTGLLRGNPATGPVIMTEFDLHFAVDIESGHKTGFYLDQRDNRQKLRALVAGKTVLDCFCYSGGFSLNALLGGASAVTAIDSSGPALAVAQANAERNALHGIEWLEADVFKSLRTLRDGDRRFDVVVLDPPKFAPTAGHAEKATRAYKDINLLAFKLLNRGGVLMSCSCSGGVNADLFQKIIAGAALDAGVDAEIEGWLHAAPDHPVALSFPEGEYLKGLICRKH